MILQGNQLLVVTCVHSSRGKRNPSPRSTTLFVSVTNSTYYQLLIALIIIQICFPVRRLQKKLMHNLKDSVIYP